MHELQHAPEDLSFQSLLMGGSEDAPGVIGLGLGPGWHDDVQLAGKANWQSS